MYSLKIKGLDELIKAADKAGGKMPQLMLQAMNESTLEIKNDAKEPMGNFKNRTGNLRRSIDRQVYSAAKGVVYAGAEYGIYVEMGTRPHVIRPRRAKALRFKVDGKYVFARSVKHPGTKAQPFMKPAFVKGVDKVQKIYDKVADIVVKSMAK